MDNSDSELLLCNLAAIVNYIADISVLYLSTFPAFTQPLLYLVNLTLSYLEFLLLVELEHVWTKRVLTVVRVSVG
jgi:hypothetical protein